MVNQSDLPFRLLVEQYGATSTYTQMLLPEKLLNDQEYLEFHLRDLQTFAKLKTRPVVVQLGGNDPDLVVQAGRKMQQWCDGIDLNLGCPQEAARDAHYGAYLLGQRDWPLVEQIVSSMATSFTVPCSAKIRLCQPVGKTSEFSQRLEAQGASWITLHARTVSARRRRQGAADLSIVQELKSSLRVPVISNGNVRAFPDLQVNLDYTGADGLMVGEALLDNPWYESRPTTCLLGDSTRESIPQDTLFSDIVPDPMQISLDYLKLCSQFPGTAPLRTVQAHVRHFVEAQCDREPWVSQFRAALSMTKDISEVEGLVRSRIADREEGLGRCDTKNQFDMLDEEEDLGIEFLH
ncbi:t-diRNAhydrouridine synthase [Coprinopsis cinerea okayama7|uniref:tRNA-dihydrouridine synthase n=1 Tax=Coprinopsis cinerea (strain Okayama-7 / 130 / ATCC MYA-4618 / FGSC 9003) TaxID=240176 RepID=A8NBX6_COPC7|nr:t-diRNAhydrouridine synthase [Coprinopsis cinerea okayama7\|eukprot:XP_001832336.2 t-diRNAhydrouridine synthase [Coprinopsis cinerea okayama7\